MTTTTTTTTTCDNHEKAIFALIHSCYANNKPGDPANWEELKASSSSVVETSALVKTIASEVAFYPKRIIDEDNSLPQQHHQHQHQEQNQNSNIKKEQRTSSVTVLTTTSAASVSTVTTCDVSSPSTAMLDSLHRKVRSDANNLEVSNSATNHQNHSHHHHHHHRRHSSSAVSGGGGGTKSSKSSRSSKSAFSDVDPDNSPVKSQQENNNNNNNNELDDEEDENNFQFDDDDDDDDQQEDDEDVIYLNENERLAVRFTLRHNTIMRRVVVARSLFRSVLQPVVSNLLVAAFKGSAQTAFDKCAALRDDEQEEGNLLLLEEAKQRLDELRKILTPVSSVRTKMPLLKVLFNHRQKSESSSSSSVVFPSLHDVLLKFMEMAGFRHSLLHNNKQQEKQEEEEGEKEFESVFLDGAWEFEGCTVLKELFSNNNDNNNSNITVKQLKECALKSASAFEKLKLVEKKFLAVFETHLEKGGLLAPDTVTFLEHWWLLEKPEEDTNNTNNNNQQQQQQQQRGPTVQRIEALLSEWEKKCSEKQTLDKVGEVLASKTEARHAAEEAEQRARYEAAKQRALLEKQAHDRAEREAQRRREREIEEYQKEISKVQHLLPIAKKTLHETGRVRNASFSGVEFKIQPLSVATRIHVCSTCGKGGEGEGEEEGEGDEKKQLGGGIEVHWHLRAAPNVLYAFTAHLSPDATKFRHLGDEIGYQYNTIPGMQHFGKTVEMNRKCVNEEGKMTKITTDVKPVTHCVCGMSFEELWE